MSESINLKVRALPNATHDVSISRQATIQDLKQTLIERTQMPLERQRLIYQGRVLGDERTLAEVGLENGHTLHLVERNPNAHPQQESNAEPPLTQRVHGTTRVTVNLGTGGQQMMYDIGRTVREVLTASGIQERDSESGNPPNTAPRDQPTERSTMGVASHLLLSLGRYIAQLESGRLQTHGIQLVSLGARNPDQTASQEDCRALTAAICQFLTEDRLSTELRSQLQTAREQIHGNNDQSSGTSTTLGGQQASADEASGNPPPNSSQSSEPYPYLPLVLAMLHDIAGRSETLVRESLAGSLSGAARQLENIAAITESNFRSITEAVRQIGSVANWYAALLIELSRIANGVSAALHGQIHPLALNTAAAVTLDGAQPSIPPLLPRVLRQTRSSNSTNSSAENTAQTQAPNQQGVSEIHVPTVSLSVEGTGDVGEADIISQVVPAIEQLTMAFVGGRDANHESNASTIRAQPAQQQQQESNTTAPLTQDALQQRSTTATAVTPAPPSTTSAADTAQPQPPQVQSAATTSSNPGGRTNAPVGLSTGLGPRLGQPGNTSKRSAPEAPGHMQAEKTAKMQSNTESSCRQENPRPDFGSMLNSFAAALSGGGGGGTQGGGGLEQMVNSLASNLANNPNIRRMTENPTVQNLVSSVRDPETGTPNVGRMLGEMGPLVASLFNPSPQQQSQSSTDGDGLSELPPDRATAWRQAFEEDAMIMETDSQHHADLSMPYLAGRVTQSSTHQNILPLESEFDE